MTKTSRKLPIAVRASSIQGKGVFATRRIRKGARIIEYRGKRITVAEADARYDDDSMGRHHTVLFEVGRGTVIDAAYGGNAARFINHSCAPNCEAVEDGERIFIEALRNIQPGVELSYNYGLKRDGIPRAAWQKLYACRCGSKRCRGTMLTRSKRRKGKGKRRP